MALLAQPGKAGFLTIGGTTYKDFRLVEKRLTELEKRLPEQGNKMLNDLANRIRMSAMGRVLVNTGRLKSSIRVHRKSRHTFTVSAGQGGLRPYAYYQEHGFRPHSFPGELWMGRETLAYPFITVGQHGKGTSWRPYMRPAFEEMTKTGKLREIATRWIAEGAVEKTFGR